MYYYLFYTDGEVSGWLQSDKPCASKNAVEVSEQDYIENGGVIKHTDSKELEINLSKDPLERMIDAVLD